MKNGKNVAVIAIIATLLLSVSVLVQAYSVYDVVYLDYQQQEKSQWCWAACGSVILNYIGPSISQTAFCQYVKRNTDDNPAYTYEVQSGLSHWGVSSTLVYSYRTYTAIQSEINTYSRPIYTVWAWAPFGYNGAHALLIDGYDSTSGQYVDYMDPADGDAHYETYTWFKGGTGYNHSWCETLYYFQ
jgi:hypothetical protein